MPKTKFGEDWPSDGSPFGEETKRGGDSLFSSSSDDGPPVKKRDADLLFSTEKERNTYHPGQHGAKTREQKRLTEKFAFKVSGTTHESEHPIGFEVLNRSSGLKRGSAGRARDLEMRAPAYQEVKAFHRVHTGTPKGLDDVATAEANAEARARKDPDATPDSIEKAKAKARKTAEAKAGAKENALKAADFKAAESGKPQSSGFTTERYRNDQRALVEDNDISSSLQINQLDYAFNRIFHVNSKESDAADDSYNLMVRNLKVFTHAENDVDVAVDVDPFVQAEAILGRKIARTGKWIGADDITTVFGQLGIDADPALEKLRAWEKFMRETRADPAPSASLSSEAMGMNIEGATSGATGAGDLFATGTATSATGNVFATGAGDALGAETVAGFGDAFATGMITAGAAESVGATTAAGAAGAGDLMAEVIVAAMVAGG